MAVLLNLRLCRMACVVAIFAAMTATAALIIGFINLGTFRATYLETTVGIWCGLLMFAHVFGGLLMLGSRQLCSGVLNFLINVVCLPFMVYGAIISFSYYEKFSEFRKHNVNGLCAVENNVCVCKSNNQVFLFKRDYTVSKCPLYSFGEDLWLTLFILLLLNALFAFLGLFTCLISLCVVVTQEEKKRFDNGGHNYDRKPLNMRVF